MRGTERVAGEVSGTTPQSGQPGHWYPRVGKRIVDVTLVLLSLPVMLPVMAALALLVRVMLGRPVLFRQARPGLHGRLFILTKFRTMTSAQDDGGQLRPDHERLTPFGRWLRRTSLDELPELFNVLKGEMSLVGPRPLLVEYLDYYTPEQHRRHAVRPGLTGLAQVTGRNATTWAQRFQLDLQYVEQCGVWLDVVILTKTLSRVWSGEGVMQANDTTMDKFQGA